ncbi:hypothetical protein BC940DRAFT_368462 [Gongronella butleri]|nr:hypothetical protein BC940DRAFT_368462 [Gongronella butleri]
MSLVKVPIRLPRNASRLHLQQQRRHDALDDDKQGDKEVNMTALANTMKLRMKAAAHLMAQRQQAHEPRLFSAWSPPSRVTKQTSPDRATLRAGGAAVRPRTLKQLALLKRYLAFVDAELPTVELASLDHEIVDPHCATITVASGSNQQPDIVRRSASRKARTLAAAGARMIEALVHEENGKHDEIDEIVDTRTEYRQETPPLPVLLTSSDSMPTPDNQKSKKSLTPPGDETPLSAKESNSSISSISLLPTPPASSPAPSSTDDSIAMSRPTGHHVRGNANSRSRRRKSQASLAQPPQETPQQQQQPIRPRPRSNNNNSSKKKTIRCICSHDQYYRGGGHGEGLMVQCDDCFHWLHTSCLALDAHSLHTSRFRCPACYIALGPPKDAHLASVIHWRYAAHWKSQKLAMRTTRRHRARRQWNRAETASFSSSSSDEADDDEEMDENELEFQDDDDDAPTDAPERSWSIPTMTIDASLASTMLPSSTHRVLVLPLSSTTPMDVDTDAHVDNGNEIDIGDDDHDSDTTIDTDWRDKGDENRQIRENRVIRPICEIEQPAAVIALAPPMFMPMVMPQQQQQGTMDGFEAPVLTIAAAMDTSMRRGSESSASATSCSDTDSPSEVSTPTDTMDEPLVDQKLPNLWTTAPAQSLDNNSLLWISHLAYLESLHHHLPPQTMHHQQQQQQQQQNHHHHQIYPQHHHQKNDPMLVASSQASNLFLTDPCLPSSRSQSASSWLPTAEPPSAICSQDLTQFTFDDGLFWSAAL